LWPDGERVLDRDGKGAIARQIIELVSGRLAKSD
jgi:hypothetical protein